MSVPSTDVTSTGVDPRVGATLCYAAWWITGLIFLFLERENREVRFHAAQSLVLFGGLSLLMGALGAASAATLLVVPSLFRSMWYLSSLIWLLGVVLWLVLMVQAFRGERSRVPWVGSVAERIAANT